MNEEIKPCPFCGSDDIHFGEHDPDGYSFMCWSCNARGPNGYMSDEAQTRWNKRPTEEKYPED